MPSLRVLHSNGSTSVCFEAYSHPSYPAAYSVNISVNGVRVLHFYLNDSKCFILTHEEFVRSGILCTPFEVSVIASNQLGDSAKTETITRGIYVGLGQGLGQGLGLGLGGLKFL